MDKYIVLKINKGLKLSIIYLNLSLFNTMIIRLFTAIALNLLFFKGLAQPTVTITSSSVFACVDAPVSFTVDTSGCGSAGQIEWFVNGASVSVGDTTGFSASTFSDGDAVSAVYTCSNGSGSATSSSVTLEIDDPEAYAGEDVIISEGASVVLNGEGNGTFVWGPSEGLSSTTSESPVASPESTTIYYLTVTSDNGCTSEDAVTVAIVTIFPMNTITPNNDGYNDFWDIVGINNYQSAKVSIYDRWGQKVFNVVGYTTDKRWDGTNRGFPLPPSTYYYVIDLNAGGDNDMVFGYVTIIK